MTSVPRRPAFPASRGKRHNTRKYSLWQWTRAYAVLLLCLPFFPIMMFLSGRKLPDWLTRKLLRRHQHYTLWHKMDFRIPPDESVPAYMMRWWRIPRNWALNIYYHIVMRSDDDRALHDHPWWSFSIVLDGGYFEHTIADGGIHHRTWFQPGMMKFRWHGKLAHRLELARQDPWELPATTIFITGPVLRRWGFHDPKHGWIDAYDWDEHCEKFGITGMRMDGGSDSVMSERNRL